MGMVLMFLVIGWNFPHKSHWRIFREGFFLLLSAHTGTGFSTVLSEDFFSTWKSVGLIFIILAMSFGGGMCSTTGGIKLLRIGVLFKSVLVYIRQSLSSPHTYVGTSFHHLKEIPLEDNIVKGAFVVFFFYLLSFFVGAVVGVGLGYDFLPSLFESVSATCNVGLSSGITSPSMPTLLKTIYIFQMWLGRLEFVTVLGMFYYFLTLRFSGRISKK